LDDYGLVKAVEWYTDIFEKQTGIRTDTRISGEPIRITGQDAIHCYRIVQEALNNAAKHSGTKLAEVEMIFVPGMLSVCIRDFGKGIATEKKSGKLGLGLIAMQERAELAGGTLKISSLANSGTTVCLEMPLRGENQPPADEPLRDVNIGGALSHK
jgi:signal transduction histidine kinase